MFPAVNPTIESGEDYFIIIYDDGRHENVCVAHFATLQLSELWKDWKLLNVQSAEQTNTYFQILTRIRMFVRGSVINVFEFFDEF